MATQISSEQILFDLVRQIITGVRPLARQCEAFNSLPNIPWHRREQVRTLEGKLEAIDQIILEFLDSARYRNLGAVDALVEELWGDDCV